MAANMFATMLHRNTHGIAVVLVYAFLEWVLIALLLLHALFSYLIAAFTSYFGLNPHCLFCSRLDRFLPSRPARVRDLVCDDHAREIARLAAGLRRETSSVREGRKLAGGRGMCEDCSSSWPALALGEERHGSMTISALVKGEEARCSSCGVLLDSGVEEMGLVLREGGWSGERQGLVDLGGDGYCTGEMADLGGVQEEVDRRGDDAELEENDLVRVEEEKYVGDDASALAIISTYEIHGRVHGEDAALQVISQSMGCATCLDEREVSHEYIVKNGDSKRKCQSSYPPCASPCDESSQDRYEYQFVSGMMFQTCSEGDVKTDMYLRKHKKEGKIEESSRVPTDAHLQYENKSFPTDINTVQVEEVSVSVVPAAMEETENRTLAVSQEIDFEIADAVPRGSFVKNEPSSCPKHKEICSTFLDANQDGSYLTRPSDIGYTEETESPIFKQLIRVA